MFWKKWFGNKEELDPLKDLVLSKLKVGYLLDYDMKTWEVAAHNRYDWGEDDFSDEWELRSGDESKFLEREEDDEVEWTLTRKIPIEELGSGIGDYIKEHDDPPGELNYQGKQFHLEGSSGGRFHKGGKDAYDEFLSWEYVEETDEYVLTIEQWSETSFEATHGKYVEEYQFTNILPK